MNANQLMDACITAFNADTPYDVTVEQAASLQLVSFLGDRPNGCRFTVKEFAERFAVANHDWQVFASAFFPQAHRDTFLNLVYEIYPNSIELYVTVRNDFSAQWS